MRLRNKPWADDYMRDNSHIVVQEPFQYRGKWQSAFNKEQPLHLEIGSGKGQFIAGMGKQHPEVNFIGLERVKSVIVGALKKVLDSEAENVRLLNEDAQDLRDLFQTNEVDHIYLNFSDPWPKTRHEKRRLTFPAFLDQYKDVLKEEGEITLKTDNRGFFEYSVASFSKYGMIVEELSLDLHELNDPLNVKTEYEEKFSEKGQPIYRCKARFQK
ncbi:tRNA (guanine-N(7)-)-methyltransferase [Halobacillus andaensis]|uniref:tRNA (guanine-N(7)-)-methyltransferase n=1 Tax=Halobacillus andaensis TaxID=1176239 RepID=A0A917EUD5_HALAA|nr:tRNA (guanosine(46)-N7)-methyltransferase TrmB [Halobacillus andaensis]MBP2002801.1 tRNA (guanine-N7-)-methyltransferase [Halobacillus andaensis]GGF05808.1 tRNA (guanine-N(7)-)-methyltransferase [Halobacillus andaensis]